MLWWYYIIVVSDPDKTLHFDSDPDPDPNHSDSICDRWSTYTVKKIHEFPVSSRDVTNQTPPGQE
jgi:hypothetical protein